MKIPVEIMFAACTLVYHKGTAAEEYATQKFWHAQQTASKDVATQWAAMLQAIKRVREIRAMIRRGL